MKPVLVVGLGNPLMRDEGIGLAVVQCLEKMSAEFPNVEFIEAGTSLMAALHRMVGRHKVVFVDCAVMGTPPGTIRRFMPNEVRSVKRLAGLSLHEGDLCAALELSQQLGECPNSVVIFGIEPERMEWGEGLSPVVAERLNEYVDAVKAELAED